MSVARCIAIVVLVASVVTLAAPVASAALIPPQPPSMDGYLSTGRTTVKHGDTTETWSWGPGYESYQSSQSSSRQFVECW
ncbi:MULTISPECIES: hypothetical protein [unclassified Streptosporangium]|uniref:hypothetical protein n=1 Tax=unclassified Streptosporangium TaxID=2632669 RepID=UPI002E2B97BA|nr:MULTISPECIES: hypothetical protein [unclassified Streptosporangium]